MPKNKFSPLFSLILVISAASSVAQVHSLKLSSGDQISGRILSENPTNLVIQPAWGGPIPIPQNLITQRMVLTNVLVATAAPTNNSAVITTTLSNNAVVKVVVTPKPPPKPPRRWTGDIQVGTDLGFSEVNRELYYGRFKINYAHQKFRNVFDYNASYGKINGIVSANRMDGSAKTDLDLNRKWYVYNLAGAGYDDIRKIELRYEVGPGLGYHWIIRSNFNLNLEGGINYQSQTFTDGTENKHLYFRLAENLSWKLSKKFTLDQKFEYFPRVEEPSEFRLRFETNLRYWFTDIFSLNFSLLDLYDSDPAAGVSQNDLQIRSSIGVKF